MLGDPCYLGEIYGGASTLEWICERRIRRAGVQSQRIPGGRRVHGGVRFRPDFGKNPTFLIFTFYSLFSGIERRQGGWKGRAGWLSMPDSRIVVGRCRWTRESWAVGKS